MKPCSPARPWRAAARIGSAAARVAVLAVVLAVALTILVPPLAGLDRLVVDGDSMAPAIPRGSIALERRVPVSELKKNDVITLTRPGAAGPVTRRIVSSDRDRLGRRVFWTKADANARPDPKPVHFESARQPRLSFHLPHAGWPLIALADPELRLLALGALALGVVVAFLPTLRRDSQPVNGARSGRPTGSGPPAREPRGPAGYEEHGAASA